MAKLIQLFISVSMVCWLSAPSYAEFDPLAVMKAQEMQGNKPQLGMSILSSSGQQTVLMGGNGRYIVTGNLIDLWDGMEQDRTTKDALTDIDPSIKASLPQLEFPIGNPDGIPLRVFITSTCKKCDKALEWLLLPETLETYDARVMLLTNDSTNANAAQYFYCAQDKLNALKEIKSSPFTIRTIDNNCDTTLANLATSMAMAMNIKALPLIYKPDVKESYFGDPSHAF